MTTGMPSFIASRELVSDLADFLVLLDKGGVELDPGNVETYLRVQCDVWVAAAAVAYRRDAHEEVYKILRRIHTTNPTYVVDTDLLHLFVKSGGIYPYEIAKVAIEERFTLTDCPESVAVFFVAKERTYDFHNGRITQESDYIFVEFGTRRNDVIVGYVTTKSGNLIGHYKYDDNMGGLFTVYANEQHTVNKTFTSADLDEMERQGITVQEPFRTLYRQEIIRFFSKVNSI